MELQRVMENTTSLTQSALSVLRAAKPAEKIYLTRKTVQAWRRGALDLGYVASVPDRPARPMRPRLVSPNLVPKRKINRGLAGRTALLHAIAHIELNAIDLAWDLIARFAEPSLPLAFVDDWVGVAAEEAEHFALIDQRLRELGTMYGDLPAHDGLWQVALETRHDLAARLAVVPLVLEARGLDVTPTMIAKLRAAEDEISAQVLEVIFQQEIGHVAVGRRWFEHVCAQRGWTPQYTWQNLVRRHFTGNLKPPFNVDARRQAKFGPDYYARLDP